MNRLWTILLLALGHGINDIYPGLLSPFLPVFIDRYGWSITQAGILVTVLQLSSNLSQPLVAFYNDRRPGRGIMSAGLLAGALPFCFMLQVPAFAAVAVLLAVCGFGVGMYHTPGVVAAGRAAQGSGSGILMGLFTAGGLIGFTLSPLVAVFFIEVAGERYLPLVLAPALAAAALIWFNRGIPIAQANPWTIREWFASLRGCGPRLFSLWLVSSLRDTTGMLVGSFLPMLLIARGYSYAESGIILSVQVFIGMFFMVAGGHISDRRGHRLILAFSLLAMTPLLRAFFATGGLLSLLFLLLAMGASYATIPITILLAQKAAPNHASTASSTVMGLSFTVGSVLATPFGALADRIGIEPAMMTLLALPVIGGILVLASRER
jgi:FSR family fosmidomycin resistance protein-like MFS transporter